MTAPLYSPLLSCETESKAEILKNWAGNLTYSTGHLDQAKSVAEAQELVKKYDKIKQLGTRHCFNKIADSDDRFVSLVGAPEDIVIAPDGKSVTVNAGIKYGELSPYLHEKGFALHNLASLPHISVAGAIATATHGSGEKNGNLASAVSGLEMITANGEIVTSVAGKRWRKIQCRRGASGCSGYADEGDAGYSAYLFDDAICLSEYAHRPTKRSF